MSNAIGLDFWEQKHQDKETWWISGSKLYSLLMQHNLNELDFKDNIVLEIGVGTGSMTSVLKDISKTLYCSDISITALKNVETLCDQTYLSKDLNKIPKVNIAFSHLVFQHCTDEEITRIINDVQLLDDGIFSFEFVSLVDGNIIESVQSFIDNGTHFFRSIEEIKMLIDKTNKKIVEIGNPEYHGKWAFESNFIKVKNK